MTLTRKRDLVTGCIVLVTLIVLMITTTSHQQINTDKQVQQQSGEAIEPTTSLHTFRTKQVEDINTSHHVISRRASSKWRQVNDSLITRSSLSPSALHTFHWIFPSRNIDWVVGQLSAVSQPTNSRYGQWLRKADVDAMTQPEHHIKQPVISWLIDNGLTDDDWENLGTMLSITAPIALIETMFNTQMQAYALRLSNSSNPNDLDLSKIVVRTSGSISIPVSLASSMAHITGLNDFPAVSELARYTRSSTVQAMASARRQRFSLRQAAAPLPCAAEVTSFANPTIAESFLAQAYNYQSRSGSTAAPAQPDRYPAIITGETTRDSAIECFSAADVSLLPSILGYSSAPRLAPLADVCSGSNAPTTQASSDFAAIYSIVPTTTIGSFYTPDNGDIAAIANMINAMPDATIPAVVAYSYSSFGDTDPSVMAADAALAQLALRGVTFIVSSGVQGANGPDNSYCEEFVADAPPGAPRATVLTAAYPASSPFVLSVGATDFLGGLTAETYSDYVNAPGQTYPGAPPACSQCPNTPGVTTGFSCQRELQPEQAVDIFQFGTTGFATGGGFANYDSGADLTWQQAAKDRYFDVACFSSERCLLPTPTSYSRARRGFPDVSAYGGFMPFVRDGQMDSQNVLPQILTSAAALWAGFITRMNEVSPSRMGFVNPYLYNMAQTSPLTFNDITSGSNFVPQDLFWYDNPASPAATDCSGFQATEGWDPVSGLGSPNLGRILDYLRANPPPPPAVNGDPTITGFHGHTMQVHGTSGEYYNLISTKNMQYNAQFVFLSEGVCTAELKNRTECWSHAGTYLGEVGVVLGGHGQAPIRIHVQAGSINEGLTVTIYDEQSETPSLLLEPSIDDTYTHDLFSLTQPSPFTAVLTTDEFVITWHNSDQFVNQQVSMQTQLDSQIESFITQQQHHFKTMNQSIKRSMVSPEHDSARQLPHGLLGQSWSERSYDNQWKWLQGNVDDYVVVDGLFGSQFLYNRFVDQAQ